MADLALNSLLLAYFSVMGATVGSFLNVVIYRLPEGLSVVRPRSRCPGCAKTIAWYDNVPILSYILLRGRCRRCKMRIAPRYVLVEFVMGALSAALWVRLGLSWEFAIWWPLCAALLAITFLDIDHWWVPDAITLPAMGLVLLASFLPGGVKPVESLLGLAPALGVWGIAWAFFRITGREGLGLGDVKLLALLGLALGPIQCLSVLFLAALQGSVIGIIVVLAGGHRAVNDPRAPEADHKEGDDNDSQHGPEAVADGDDQDSENDGDSEGADDGEEEEWVPHPRAIPFGPFLVLGALEVVLLPEVFGEWPGRLAGWLLGLSG